MMARNPDAEFTETIKIQAVVACKRHCVLCERYSGTNLTCHHIISVANGGDGSLDNCIPLCLNCHGDVGHYDPKHPQGLKYRPEELRRRRDAYYAKLGEVVTSSESYLQTDRATLLGILAILPSDSKDIRMLKDHPFGASFQWSSFDQISKFRFEMSGPEHEFLDEQLEDRRKLLHQSFNDFIAKLANYTIIERDGWAYIHADKYGPNFMRMTQELDELSTKAYEQYIVFVRFARRHLGI